MKRRVDGPRRRDTGTPDQAVASLQAKVLHRRLPLPLGKEVLDEKKGQVPLFYSERVALTGEGGADEFPFFFDKEDLDATFGRLQQGELPIGDVKVVTLDGLVKQMREGAVDFSTSVLVGSRASLALSRQLKGGADGLGRQ